MNDDKVSSRNGIGLIATFTCIINSLIVVLHKSTGFDLMTSLIVYAVSAPLGVWGLWNQPIKQQNLREDKQ